jgi:hypothetical protein
MSTFKIFLHRLSIAGALGLLCIVSVGPGPSWGRPLAIQTMLREVGRSCIFTNAKHEHLRIEPQTSRLTCKVIKETVALLPSDIGVWPLYSDGKVTEICRIFAPGSRVHIRCHPRGQRGRHFEIVASLRKEP